MTPPDSPDIYFEITANIVYKNVEFWFSYMYNDKSALHCNIIGAPVFKKIGLDEASGAPRFGPTFILCFMFFKSNSKLALDKNFTTCSASNFFTIHRGSFPDDYDHHKRFNIKASHDTNSCSQSLRFFS